MNNVDCKGNPLKIGDILYAFKNSDGKSFSGSLICLKEDWYAKIIIDASVYTGLGRPERRGCFARSRVVKIPPYLIEARDLNKIKVFLRLGGIDISDFNPDNYLP